MNEVMDMGNTMLNVGQTMEVLIATIVVGVLLSLFGLKLVRVLTTIVGLVLGAGVGLVISHLLGWSGLTVAIVTLGCAVVLAALSFFLYRMGVFFTVFVSCDCFIGRTVRQSSDHGRNCGSDHNRGNDCSVHDAFQKDREKREETGRDH